MLGFLLDVPVSHLRLLAFVVGAVACVVLASVFAVGGDAAAAGTGWFSWCSRVSRSSSVSCSMCVSLNGVGCISFCSMQ